MNQSSTTLIPESFQKELGSILEKCHPPNSQMESWRKFSFPKGYLEHGFAPEKNLSTAWEKTWDNSFQNFLNFYREEYLAVFSLKNATEIRFFEAKGNETLVLPNLEFSNESLWNIPVTFLKVPDNSQVYIQDSLEVKGEVETLSLVSSLVYLEIGNNCKVDWISSEKFTDSSLHFKFCYVRIGKDSELSHVQATTGGFQGKEFYDYAILGSNSRVDARGAGVFQNRNRNDIEMRMLHENGNSSSNILYKTIVGGKAHHLFTGNLHIPTGIQKIKADQMNRNITLSKSARAESIPKLEVFSDEVSTSHGATVGELGEDEIFFLNSRGLNLEEAKALLLSGFFQDVFEIVEKSEFTEALYENLMKKVFTP